MKAIYNSRILDETEISLQIGNRAFCYGDGLFETIVTGPHRINLIPLHIARLARACKLLEMELPIDEPTLTQQIAKLKEVNQLTGQIRIRVQLWRDTGGLYTPEQTNSSYLITIAPSEKPFYSELTQLSLSKKARVAWHALSFAKTMSAMPYVVAGIEKKQSTYDDLVITDTEGNIAEAIISNIFWVHQGEVFTPALATGCVAGTMRQHVMMQLKKSGMTASEVTLPLDSLLKAEHVFLTNAAGIQWVAAFENQVKYADPKALLIQAAILPPEL